MDSPWKPQKSFMVAHAWTLETKKAFDRQRVGQGHSKLREGVCTGSGAAFCGWSTGDEEQVTGGKGGRGLMSLPGGASCHYLLCSLRHWNRGHIRKSKAVTFPKHHYASGNVYYINSIPSYLV